MKEKMNFITGAIIVIIAIAISLVINFPVMLLWNWLMPKLLHTPELSYWEAYGLFWLISLLTLFFRTPKKR